MSYIKRFFAKFPLEASKQTGNNLKIAVRLIYHKPNYSASEFPKFHEELTGEKLKRMSFNNFVKFNSALGRATLEELKDSYKKLSQIYPEMSEIRNHYQILALSYHLIEERINLLKESGFHNVSIPMLSRFRKIVTGHSIAHLKNEGLLENNTNVKMKLLDCFPHWPKTHPVQCDTCERTDTLLKVRLEILHSFLSWKLSMSPEEIEHHIKTYVRIKYKPFIQLQESVDLLMNEFQMTKDKFKKYGLVMNVMPSNIKEILTIDQIAGLDIRSAVEKAPHILLNKKEDILNLDKLFQDHNVPQENLHKHMAVYSVSYKTISKRLEELSKTDKYKILISSHRFAAVLVSFSKAMRRLEEMEKTKTCFSMLSLVFSETKYKKYISSLGSNVSHHDHAALICYELKVDLKKVLKESQIGAPYETTWKQLETCGQNKNDIFILKRAFYALTRSRVIVNKYHCKISLEIVHANIKMLQKHFNDEVIFNNCQVLFYHGTVVERNVVNLKMLQRGVQPSNYNLDELDMPKLDYTKLNDNQILSLTLYVIEKRFNFSDEGVWMEDGKYASLSG